MPLVSVVVSVYNVEPYLRACLTSVAQQTVGELEVIVVDDGSTDGSAAIAHEFTEANDRFRLISQRNGGLGNARNNGADAATGEFLAFVDGDDVLPRNAYELLLEGLTETGSDFATGNVHRLSEAGATSQAPFLARTFAETRLRSHVTRFRPLLEDRIVPNKLWRRSFWDAQGFRFPEGMLHEDIPVVVPAQFAARSVDVIAEPVYLYRTREGADLSITQRRAEKRALLDRLRAIEMVLAHFDRNGMRRARRWYERSIVAHDLGYYLNVLDIADDEYRALFLDRVNALLDGVPRRVYTGLRAINRLKWHLVRRRLIDEVLDVLRFQRERLNDTPPVRVGRRWYGDYPFRTDRRLRIPRSVYRLREELTLAPHLDELRWDGETLRVRGHAFIGGIGAPSRDSQRVSVSLLSPGRLRPLRQRLFPIRMRTVAVERPDVAAAVAQSWCDAAWSGFEATLDARRLRGRDRRWDLYITVTARGVTRRRARFSVDGVRAVRSAERILANGALAAAWPAPSGQVSVRVERQWMCVEGGDLRNDVLELWGRLVAASPMLQLVGSGGVGRREYAVKVDGGSFRVGLPLADLASAADWDLYLVDGGVRRRVLVSREALWPLDGRELLLGRSRLGHALLATRMVVPFVTGASWTPDGTLELRGSLPAGELVLVGRDQPEEHAFAIGDEARLPATRVPSLSGELPLPGGGWDLYLGADELVPVLLPQTLYEQLPLATDVQHKRFALGVTGDGRAFLDVQPDLDLDERGRFHQRRLREAAYAPRRSEELRDAVVYSSFGGRQYSDSPRRIHEELVRRGSPLEHLWIVRDGMCNVPATATPLREGSREYYEALARARFVVANDRLPDWFAPRDDQVCLHTSHGTPLRRLEPSHTRWSYVLSPNRASTLVLREAFGGSELLETGLPRTDVLAHPDRANEVRERLALPENRRVVLYAPTYRDGVVDSQGRHRLDLHLDLDRLRRAIGDHSVILFRKHHRVVDAAPSTADGFVRDVSSYPDATELLLAADVLVTDYSSIAVDFANTGRPMLFFTYDLDAQRDTLLFDFEHTMPGPLLRTTDELAEALNDLGDVPPPEYRSRYAEFARTYCELDDGHAAARVVDRVF